MFAGDNGARIFKAPLQNANAYLRDAIERIRTIIPWLLVITILLFTNYDTANAAQIATCSLDGTQIAFGSYDPLLHRDLPSIGMVRFRCDGEVKRLTIGLTSGESSSFAVRKMRQGSRVLFYNLYLDAAGTQVWGDGTGGSQVYTATSPPDGTYISIPVFGRVFRNQKAAGGGYRDNISVTLNY